MWPFSRQKTVEDYIRQIVRMAVQVRKSLRGAVNASQAERIKVFLQLLLQFDIKQFREIKKELRSERLMQECLAIHALAKEAQHDIAEQHAFEKAGQVLDRIIALETYLEHDLAREVRFIPSEDLSRVLAYSPKQAFAHRFLFRGVSDEDFARAMRGMALSARNPHAHAPLIRHILDPSNTPDTQFISLTPDVRVAMRFGRVIAVAMSRLRGRLLYPADIEHETGGDTRVKRLVKKNMEFVLAPTSNSFALIPPEAMIR